MGPKRITSRAVSINWGSFQKGALGVAGFRVDLGVLRIRDPVFGVYIRAPVFFASPK